jgi:hypothetical protein
MKPLFLPIFSLGEAAHLPWYSVTRCIIKPFALPRNGLAGRRIIPTLAGLMLAVQSSAVAFAQCGPPPPLVSKPAPPEHLWYVFLKHISIHDQLATKREAEGRDDAGLRGSVQHSLGFTDGEFPPLHETAQRLEAELHEIDAKAKAFIDADHAVHPMSPERKAQRRQFSQQRAAVIESEVSDLQSALGPEDAARLDTYIQTRFAHKENTQNPNPEGATANSQPATSSGMYYRFLMSVNSNDCAAAKVESEGKDSTWQRSRYQKTLGFSDEQFALVRATAQRLKAKTDEILGNMMKADMALAGPVPPELTALTHQRKAMIESEISNLQNALGPDLSAKVDEYIHTHIRSTQATGATGPNR